MTSYTRTYVEGRPIVFDRCKQCGESADITSDPLGWVIYCLGHQCCNSTRGVHPTPESAVKQWNAQRNPKLHPQVRDILQLGDYTYVVTDRRFFGWFVSCIIKCEGYVWKRSYLIWEWRDMFKCSAS